MFQKFAHSYYSKLILLCTMLVFCITGSLLYLCHRLIIQQETARCLVNYESALNTMASSLTSRISGFPDFVYPLAGNTDAYDALCRLYCSASGDLSSADSDTLLSTLHTMCSSDSACKGLLLVTRFGKLYQYDTRYGTLISINLGKTTFRFTPYQIQLLSDTQLSLMSYDFDKPVSRLYGISGTVFEKADDSATILGYLIALFSPDEFHTPLKNPALSDSAEFLLLSDKSQVLYSSSGNYSPDSTTVSAVKELSSRSIFSDPVSVSGERAYIGRTDSSSFPFSAVCVLPESAIPYSSQVRLLLLGGLGITLGCMLLYGFALRSSNRRVNNIRNEIAAIGKHDLSYRISVPNADDEFTSIIRSLNRMCDKLQKHVEATYVFELSQRKAELYAMQTSINPHFLYNALEQIRVQLLHGSKENASQMLLLLSKMYRYQTKQDLFISIGEECAQTENLINLYSYRFTDCDYEFDVNNSLRKYGLPKNILQPLIENCFVHGFRNEDPDGYNMIRIAISKQQEGDRQMLLFLVENTGVTLSAETFASLQERLSRPVIDGDSNGFALSNVNSRLKLIFGEDAALHLSPMNDGTGFCVSFRIPPVLPHDLSEHLKEISRRISPSDPSLSSKS